MKFLSILAFAALSSSAFAQMCEVDMVDRYSRVVRTFRAYGDINCYEGMKECRKAIRMSPQLGGVECLKISAQGPQGPQGPQYPQQPQGPQYPQQPQGPQYPSQGSTRMLNVGESVIYKNANYTVIGVAYNGSVALKDSWGYITQGARREEISVTNGCSNSYICTSNNVVNLSTKSMATVAGLRFQDGFILKDSWGYLSSVSSSQVAVTQGCSGGYYSQVCVGNQVLAQDNSYRTVVAIQQDGRVVLKDSWGYLSINHDIQNLIVTR